VIYIVCILLYIYITLFRLGLHHGKVERAFDLGSVRGERKKGMMKDEGVGDDDEGR